MSVYLSLVHQVKEVFHIGRCRESVDGSATITELINSDRNFSASLCLLTQEAWQKYVAIAEFVYPPHLPTTAVWG